MTESDEIMVLPPSGDDFEEERLESPVERRPNWPLILGAGFAVGLATALAANWFMRPAVPEAYDASALERRIESLEATLAALENRPAPMMPEVDLSPLMNRIEALEARPEVDPLNEEVVARLEALQAEGFELPEMPEISDVSGIVTRIDTLESRVEAVSRELETRPVAPVQAASEPVVDPATLPRFPVQVLRNGAAERGGSGFVRRTFSRHVRLRGSDNPDVLIDGIVEDLAQGRPRAALEKFDRLPEGLQSLARGWRADMEDALQ